MSQRLAVGSREDGVPEVPPERHRLEEATIGVLVCDVAAVAQAAVAKRLEERAELAVGDGSVRAAVDLEQRDHVGAFALDDRDQLLEFLAFNGGVTDHRADWRWDVSPEDVLIAKQVASVTGENFHAASNRIRHHNSVGVRYNYCADLSTANEVLSLTHDALADVRRRSASASTTRRGRIGIAAARRPTAAPESPR